MVLSALLGCATGGAPARSVGASTLIRGALVIDGTGQPGRVADVRIIGDRIADVGDGLREREGETVIVASGLALAPGFIDTHSHSDEGIFTHRDALADVSQGVTTVVVGQDGDSPYPLADFFARLEREPATVNVAAYVGHGTLRAKVMGDDFRRAATAAEVARMKAMLTAEMRSGALGLSTGLEYDPGIYSDTGEVLSLAHTAAASGGRYISHIRSEDRAFWKAIDEIIAIGREAKLPVQVSHIKLAQRSLWGEGDSLVHVLERARGEGVAITADIYPYTYWHSTIEVLFPARDFENRAAAAYAISEVTAPEGLILARYEPNAAYAGHTLAEIARLRGTDDTTALLDLVRESRAASARAGHDVQEVMGTSMDERDVMTLLAWPWADLCSDGELDGKHPRGFGAFTRFLGRYVREQHVVTLETAVRKMTSLAAANVGLQDRGLIGVGLPADLVLFDPQTVTDRATVAEPHLTSSGIRRVWVNGLVVYENGAATRARPGRVLRRAMRTAAR